MRVTTCAFRDCCGGPGARRGRRETQALVVSSRSMAQAQVAGVHGRAGTLRLQASQQWLVVTVVVLFG